MIEEIKHNRRLLREYALDLVLDYGFWPDKRESKIIRDFINTIETDFLGFHNNYAIAAKWVRENLPPGATIVDIGCCWGLQSYMFKGYEYIGLDRFNYGFCKVYDNHRFVCGVFPFVCPEGDVFICSMSLGYDDSIFRGRNREEVENLIAEKLGSFQYGFTVAPEWVNKLLAHQFVGECINASEKVIFWHK